jgi:hypothetical protein
MSKTATIPVAVVAASERPAPVDRERRESLRALARTVPDGDETARVTATDAETVGRRDGP